MRVAIGVAIAALHAAAFALLADRCRGTELAVELRAPPAAAAPAIDGDVPAALARHVETELAGAAPGLVRRTWTVRYRGGIARSVGAAQLVGPFQDPAARACTGRVVIGQRLLDDGRAGPGTIAGELAAALTAELAGESFVGAGSFRRVDALTVRWAQLAKHPGDLFVMGFAQHGYVRVTARLVFDRIDVPILVALRPEVSVVTGAAELRFHISARAELAFGNRVFQWLSDRLGGDGFASRLARRQIDDNLVQAFAPPPPFALPGGHTIAFTYCGGPPEIVEGAYGALPFAVAIGPGPGGILPPRHGPARRAPLGATAAAAIDLDLDALNALLFELWRSGFLDRTLAATGLDRRFNEDATVAEFLSLRVSPLALALPPVLAAAPHGLRLSADARVAITDAGATAVGRVWGGLEFAFAARVDAPLSVQLGALELSCERTPTTLVPCYSELVAALRDRGADLHGELTQAFARLLADLFVHRRLGASGLPADLVIRAATPSVMLTPGDPRNASLHLDLDAGLTSRAP